MGFGRQGKWLYGIASSSVSVPPRLQRSFTSLGYGKGRELDCCAGILRISSRGAADRRLLPPRLSSTLVTVSMIAFAITKAASTLSPWPLLPRVAAAFVASSSRFSSPRRPPRPFCGDCKTKFETSGRRKSRQMLGHVRSKSSLGVAENGATPNEKEMTRDALSVVDAAIEAVDPGVAVRNRLNVEWNNDGATLVARADANRRVAYDLASYDNVKILAFGKASAAMALAAADALSSASSKANSPSPRVDGIAIIKDDHATEREIESLRRHDIAVRSASHPVPDARSVAAADEILEAAFSSDERTLIVACISGGGSALFCSPREGLSLDDLTATNSRLLESGMPIECMNVIRKRLERGKGGRLAAAAYPATMLTLVLSDIIGDPLDLIASGPTVPDPSNWNDAWDLVEEYGMIEGGDHELPPAVLELLKRGKDEGPEDTPESSHPAFSAALNPVTERGESMMLSETILVGNNHAAVMAAAEKAQRMGYNPVILGTRIEGEATVVARTYVAMAESLSLQRSRVDEFAIAPLPAALIAGGETTVTLPPKCGGRGGRNQELALSAALKMSEMGLRDVVLASVGTDGTDGPTDAAGAVVHGGLINDETIRRAKEALKNHGAYDFFCALDDADSLVMTGPTGTNVADVCVTLVR